MSEIAPKRNNPNLVLVNKLNDDEIGRIFSYFSSPSDVFNCLVVSRRFLEVSNSRGFENVTFDIQSAFRWEELSEEDEPFEEHLYKRNKRKKKKETGIEDFVYKRKKKNIMRKNFFQEKKKEEEEEEPPVYQYVRRIRLPEFIMRREEFLHVIKSFPSLRSITFMCSKKSEVEIHREYLSHFAGLRSLIFHGPFSLPTWESFKMASFPKLTRLEFDGCGKLDAQILDFSIFPRLKVLSVLGPCGRSPHTHKKILQLAPRLELLRICGCRFHKPVLSPDHYKMNEDGCSDVTGSYYFCKNCPSCPTCNQALSENIHVGIQEVCDGCDVLICPTCVEEEGRETCACENHEKDAKTLCPECHKQDGTECECGERICQDCRMKCEKCDKTVCRVECGTPFCEICQEGIVQNDWCKDCCECINCSICGRGPLCNGCVGIRNKGRRKKRSRKKRCVDCQYKP